jgi:hypothetical protein
MKANQGSRDTALLFLNLGARWEWVVKAMSRPLNVVAPYPLFRRLGVSQGQSGGVRKILFIVN